MFQNLDHIAMAVRNIDEKRQIFENLLSFTFLSEEIIETEKVKVVYLKSPGTKIELIQPLEGNQSLTKFLEKKGEAIHHICYLVSNIEEAINKLKQKGALFIEPAPRPGSQGAKVAFLHPKATGGILIELKEKKNES